MHGVVSENGVFYGTVLAYPRRMPPEPPVRFDSSWEQPPHSVPWVIETSANGKFVIAQWGQASGPGGAAIWDVATKKTVWRVRGTHVLTWIGNEVVALESRPAGETLVWYDWATRAELGAIAVRLPLGRLTHAPRMFGNDAAKVAGLVWIDQTEGGMELFRREPSGWTQLPSKGWWQDRCNLVGDAVFSAGGSHVALPVGVPFERLRNPDGYFGVAVVWDTRSLEYELLDIVARVAPGWQRSPGAPPVPVVTRFDASLRLSVRAQNGHVVELAPAGVGA